MRRPASWATSQAKRRSRSCENSRAVSAPFFSGGGRAVPRDGASDRGETPQNFQGGRATGDAQKRSWEAERATGGQMRRIAAARPRERPEDKCAEVQQRGRESDRRTNAQKCSREAERATGGQMRRSAAGRPRERPGDKCAEAQQGGKGSRSIEGRQEMHFRRGGEPRGIGDYPQSLQADSPPDEK